MDTNELHHGSNSGLLISPPRVTDFIAGGITGITPEVRLETGDWTPYLPQDEMQVGVYFDTMACVTFSALNVIETQLNFMLANEKFTVDTIQKLTDLGVLKDRQFNFSDRFTAKMSGTTRQGNYLVKVWDSIRNDGLLSEADWSYPREQRQPVFDWDDYYKEIPQELKDKAKKILEVLEFKYEWLTSGNNATKTQIEEWQKMAPIQIATAICPPWNSTEVILGCSLSVGHATMVSKASTLEYIDIFDHYNPFRKRLDNNYPIPFALRGVVSIKNSNLPPLNMTNFIEGTMYQLVEGHGGAFLFSRGQLLTGEESKILFAWIVMHNGDAKGKTGTLVLNDLKNVQLYDMSRKPIINSF